MKNYFLHLRLVATLALIYGCQDKGGFYKKDIQPISNPISETTEVIKIVDAPKTQIATPALPPEVKNTENESPGDTVVVECVASATFSPEKEARTYTDENAAAALYNMFTLNNKVPVPGAAWITEWGTNFNSPYKNSIFLHSFDLSKYNGSITSAKLEVGLKGLGPDALNDSLRIVTLNTDKQNTTSAPLVQPGNISPTSPEIAVSWGSKIGENFTTGSTKLLDLDLTKLKLNSFDEPGDINFIQSMNSTGSLHLWVQDDSQVNLLKLSVTYKSTSCAKVEEETTTATVEASSTSQVIQETVATTVDTATPTVTETSETKTQIPPVVVEETTTVVITDQVIPEVVGPPVINPEIDRGPASEPETVVCDPLAAAAAQVNLTDKNGILAHVYEKPNEKRLDKYFSEGKHHSEDVILSQLNVPTRDFTQGFNSSDTSSLIGFNGKKLIEFFGLDMKTKIKLDKDQKDGWYEFAFLADDGAKLVIDGEEIVNYQDQTATRFMCAKKYVYLSKDKAVDAQIQYFQGPKVKIAVMLLYKKVNVKSEDIDPNTKRRFCNLTGSDKFFTNGRGTPNYHAVMNDGFVIVPASNFNLPNEIVSNPCTKKTAAAEEDAQVPTPTNRQAAGNRSSN